MLLKCRSFSAFMLLHRGTELAPAKVLQVADVQPYSTLGRGGSLDVK
jgi:hypothetical protein